MLYGYAERGNPILGFQSSIPPDNKPALTLSYANGPNGLEANESRANLTGVNYNDTDFMQQALVKEDYEFHAGEDVGKYHRLSNTPRRGGKEEKVGRAGFSFNRMGRSSVSFQQ